MKHKTLIGLVVGIALVVAPAAQAVVAIDGGGNGNTQVSTAQTYIAGVTDFPTANVSAAQRYIPGVTDFPRGYRLSPQTPTAVVAPSGDGFPWITAGIGTALAAALGLALIGSALIVRRRHGLAYS